MRYLDVAPVFLLSFFLLSILFVPASAVGIDSGLEDELQTQTLNELSIQLAVSRYFAQRQEYLKGNTDIIAGAVTAISTDEASHKAIMESASISIIDSSVVINDIVCWDYFATATVMETATFLIGEETVQEVICHTLILSEGPERTLLVWDDGFKELASGYVSCSFVPPNMQLPVEINAPSINAVPCIVAVANNEVGTAETSTGWTKYGAWYGDIYNDSSFDTADWCATFVSWCANRASISTSVIPCYGYAPYHRDFFANRGRYYLSRSQGGSYTPQPGDLFFQFGTSAAPTHIGIVYYVSGNYVYLIDGNCDDKVNTHCFSLSANSLVGFAHPNYTYTSHRYATTWSTNSTHHWYKCTLCGIGTSSKAAHSMQTDNITGETYCTVCSYGRESVMPLCLECDHRDQ